MSLLEQIKVGKLRLMPTETLLTYSDGRRSIQSGGIVRLLEGISHGFVVDTCPDTIPACVLEHGLYLGSQDAIDDDNIREIGITHILSVGIDTPIVPLLSCVICKFVPCLDLPETDIQKLCEVTNEFITDAFRNNGRILVHCNAGVSRSATVVLAYLIMCQNFTFAKAYELVKVARPCIQPNEGFLKQLKQLERRFDQIKPT